MTINTQHQTRNTQQLTDAFHIFNELSQNLSESYQGLEQQVTRLHTELNAARSERIKTLIEKEKLSNQLQKILAALPAGVVILDNTDKVIDCNAVAVELLGKSLIGTVWADAVETRLIAVADAPQERRAKNGKRVSISHNLFGHGTGQIILLTDVSEMRALQDIVHQKKHLSAMGEMVASMAHQVRTPLSTAILYASQLRSPALSEDKHQKFSKKILERLHYLERQVNDMLIFAREGLLVMEEFSLSTMLNSISDAMEDYQTGRHFHFEISNSTQIDAIVGNENALRGAIMNLLGNAVEVVPEAGSIHLSVRQVEAGNVLFEIADNGPGINESDRARIFEPFFTTRANGTGLGLAVVNSVMQAHKGRVQCISSVEGSVFSLLLPTDHQDFTPLTSAGDDVNQVMEINHETV